jgi:hypothetical protein
MALDSGIHAGMTTILCLTGFMCNDQNWSLGTSLKFIRRQQYFIPPHWIYWVAQVFYTMVLFASL